MTFVCHDVKDAGPRVQLVGAERRFLGLYTVFVDRHARLVETDKRLALGRLPRGGVSMKRVALDMSSVGADAQLASGVISFAFADEGLVVRGEDPAAEGGTSC